MNIKSLDYLLGCCIYEKPKEFGESSSDESEDECEHCHGHKDGHNKIIPGQTITPSDSITPRPGKSSHILFICIIQ